MKILHVIANLAPRYGGPSTICWETARAVAAMGHEMSIYTTNQDGPGVLPVDTGSPQWREGVEVRYFPIQKPQFWGTSLPLAQALRVNIPDFDLVHIHSLYLFHGLVAGHYCRKYDVPYLIQPHGSLDPFLYRHHRQRKRLMELTFQNRYLRRASAILYNSEEEQKLAAPVTFQTPGIVVSLGIDFDEFKVLPAFGRFRAKFPEIGDKAIILFLSRINFKKGLDLLAQGFGAVARARDNVHLVVAGPDNEGLAAQVRLWLQDEGVLDRATFTGMLLGPDKMEVFRDATMFVLPSYTENFGLAIIEAMAAELPVIISNKINIWPMVAEGGAGRVIDCDAGSVERQILDLLDHPQEAREMGRRGRDLAKARLTWSQVCIPLEEAYIRIVEEHRARQALAKSPMASAAEG